MANQELQEEELAHLRTMIERDAAEDAIDEIASALGVETEYSNNRDIQDVTADCVEKIATLESQVKVLREALEESNEKLSGLWDGISKHIPCEFPDPADEDWCTDPNNCFHCWGIEDINKQLKSNRAALSSVPQEKE